MRAIALASGVFAALIIPGVGRAAFPDELPSLPGEVILDAVSRAAAATGAPRDVEAAARVRRDLAPALESVSGYAAARGWAREPGPVPRRVLEAHGLELLAEDPELARAWEVLGRDGGVLEALARAGDEATRLTRVKRAYAARLACFRDMRRVDEGLRYAVLSGGRPPEGDLGAVVEALVRGRFLDAPVTRCEGDAEDFVLHLEGRFPRVESETGGRAPVLVGTRREISWPEELRMHRENPVLAALDAWRERTAGRGVAALARLMAGRCRAARTRATMRAVVVVEESGVPGAVDGEELLRMLLASRVAWARREFSCPADGAPFTLRHDPGAGDVLAACPHHGE